MKILSFGAGTQSTALALMSCENAIAQEKGLPFPHPLVPIYDAVVICDLGAEPYWVRTQTDFVHHVCEQCGIPFYEIDTHLYQDLINNYGYKRTVAIPWWTKMPDGRTGKIGKRACTGNYKIDVVSQFARWNIIGYKKGQKTKAEDIKAHEMHIGFSVEEKKRCGNNSNKLFVNCYPLIEMELDRAANYTYTKDVWGLDTRASACSFCPFHQNAFFQYMKDNDPECYQKILNIDHILRDRPPYYPMTAEFFISRSFKRIEDLTPEDCNDAQCFEYCGKCSSTPEMVWNGF